MAFRLRVNANSTDVTVPIMVVDSTDGTPETGYAYNTAGIDLWYRRGPTGAETSITEATQTVTGAHSDGGVVHVSDGRGRLDLPDAALAAGVPWVEYGGTITGMIVIGGFIELVTPTAITGTFSGTHTSTTSNLGTNAPANDITGMTLFNPTDGESRVITSYVTGTGVATHAAWDTGAGVTDGEPWVLIPTAPIDTVTLAAINAEADTAISDYAPATASALTTAQNDLDIITGASGVVLQDGSITAAKIAANAITADKIATDAITAAKIAADAIGASELATDAVNEIVAAIFARTYDATDMSNITFEEMTALMACALLAKASGLDTATAVFRNLADGADAITATVDADGNRSAVTLTLASVR